MKKESVFRSFSAKLALAVLAISGAFLAGCSKDDGLDVEVVVPLPEAKYAVSVTVLDAATMQPLSAAITDGTNSTTAATATFSYSSAQTVTITATLADQGSYTSNKATTTVAMAEIGKGQSVVYPVVLYFTPKVVEPTMIDLKYDVTLSAYNNSGVEVNADFTVKKPGSTDLITDLTGLTYGTYIVTAKAAGYTDATGVLELAYVEVEEGTPNFAKEMSLVMQDAPVQYLTLTGLFMVAGKSVEFKQVTMRNADTKKFYGTDSGWGYTVEIPTTDLTAVTRTLTGDFSIKIHFEAVDMADNTIEFNEEYVIDEEALEGGNVIVDSDIQFSIRLKEESGESITKDIENIQDLPMTNATEDVMSRTIQYTRYAGIEIAFPADFTATTPIEELVKEAYEKELKAFDVSIAYTSLNIPAMTAVTKLSIVQTYAITNYTPILQISNKDGELTEEGTISGIPALQAKEAGEILIKIAESIGIGHGHGNNSNAGGGTGGVDY